MPTYPQDDLELQSSVHDQSQFTGIVRYVSQSGNNGNSGLAPSDAFLTIAYAISQSGPGDAIRVGYGFYDESGLDLNLSSLELWLESGCVLQDSNNGTVLTVSGFGCKVVASGNVRIDPTGGATGVLVSGSFCWVEQLRINANAAGAIGMDITGGGAWIVRCRCSSPTTVAFKIQASKVRLEQCCTGGDQTATIGFWVTNSCDKTRLAECGSQGHATAGFQFDAGCTNIMARLCDSGGGDGHFKDNAENTFLDIVDKDSREHHEHTYPSPDGEGTAGDPITVQSQINDETGSDDTKDYYGDVAEIVSVGDIAVDWFFKGVNFFATTTNDDQRFYFYRVVATITATRNGGNAWDEGETQLTVQDATEAAQFATGDLIWVRSPNYKPDGEIVEVTGVAGAVITIARQIENSGRTGLHWDHTTNDAGNEEIYLCWRDENRYRSSDFDYSAASGRDFFTSRMLTNRRMKINDGIIVRMINGTDGANSQCDVTIIWSD